ncbi:ATP-dependent DNA helicase [Streptomyces sp. RKND-216]|uniref:HelD family protein n=1 Tax=Streptomyces sp. RKND-216 TaxID=2562581 RepID=UPI00109DBBFF|nr:UvrD-helicase domain-containing protein [Streptomyces sp. RKND-216]THA27859.1 ATP-dependent DNA helicase [Streptomyces sp. RKND-216]
MRKEQRFVAGLYDRVDALRGRAESTVRHSLGDTGTGQQARLERDITVHEQSHLLAALDAVDSGLCFGRIDLRDGGHHHIGRVGVREDDADRTPVLIDWRAPVARPFYLATGHAPMGLRRRRHLATSGREVTALHDEILDLDDTERTGLESHDADAVLLAALDAARTGRMHDIVQTIQAEQDRIIRAPHRGVRVVEGGPGTGKTAVALHRAAYLLYEYRELLARRAVLIVGPNPAFLGYIGEVLPSLGETGVLLSTVGELFPGVTATGTDTEEAAEVKGRAGTAEVIARAVRDRQALPDPVLEIDHDGDVLVLDRETVRATRDKARATGLPHNVAREHFEGHLLNALTDQRAGRLGADPFGGPNLLDPSDVSQIRSELDDDPAVHAAIDALWPSLTPQRLVAELLADPEGHFSEADARAVRRPLTAAWTPADVPLLDEAAELLGEDDRAAQTAAAAERRRQVAYAQGVLDVAYASRTYEFEDLDAEDSEVLGVQDVLDAETMAERQEEADHRTAAERAAADRTWAFGHIVVDEAQELSPMAWRLLMRRCPTRSFTLVGDPAQSSTGTRGWREALEPYVGDRWEHIRLGVNYRTPAEIMDYAAEQRRADHPDFEPPRSVRSTGVPPWERTVAEDALPGAVAQAVAAQTPADEGRLAVVAPRDRHAALAAVLPEATHGDQLDLTRRVVLLDARQAKGLEFDTVLVVEPDRFAANDRYVALTRATQRLGVIRVRG